jgi:pheromone a factor receptor
LNPFWSSLGYVGYRLVKHRQDFKRLVNNSDTALTTSRFVRLGLLSTAFFLLNLPLSVYNLVITVPAVGPYLKYSWRAIHYDVSA